MRLGKLPILKITGVIAIVIAAPLLKNTTTSGSLTTWDWRVTDIKSNAIVETHADAQFLSAHKAAV